MHINDLESYKQARELCAHKRFETKGRRLDNYTVIRLVDKDKPTEHIEICQRTWKDGPRPIGTTLYPDDTAYSTNIRWFTTHHHTYLMGITVGRNNRGHYVCYAGQETCRADRPIKFKLGRTWRILEGEPVPAIEKSAEGSLEWQRAKRDFDKVFKVYCKLALAHSEYLRPEVRQEFRTQPEYRLQPDHFVKAVKTADHEYMVRLLLSAVYWYAATPEQVAERIVGEYAAYYRRRRTQILVAAGARVEAV